jgi:hypothetical protein
VKEYNLKQSVIIVIAGLALLWVCLYFFVFPFLVGGGPEKFPVSKMQIVQISGALKQFKAVCGKLPTGDDSIIFRTLYGSNSLHICFLNPGRTNSDGVMVDPWKSPYQIQFIDQTNFLIRSAGKNAKFGDVDDIIFNSVSNDFVKP